MSPVSTRVATMDGQSPRCPKCGEANCAKVMPRHGLAIGLVVLFVAMVAAGAFLLIIKRIASPAWAPLTTIPVFFLSVWMVGTLANRLFEILWRCPACDARFKFDRAG